MCFVTYISLRVTHQDPARGFASLPPSALAPGIPSPGHISSPCPHSSVSQGCRNLNLLSIDYAFRPRLRSRLTQGRSALPWIPWIFGHKDSHLILATHSGILSSHKSTTPYSMASTLWQCSPTNVLGTFLSFGVVFEPRSFSAQGFSASELLRTL